MLQEGWLDEVQKLLEMGFGLTPALRTVGYRECVTHLKEGTSREDLVEQVVTSTMQLAKKQMTWLRKDPTWNWCDYNDTAHIRDMILLHLSRV